MFPMFHGFNRKYNRGAFGGNMHCPFCSKYVDPTTTPIGFETDKPKVRELGNIGPFMREYKCMLCGGEWRYDVQKRQVHPYSLFKKGLKNVQLPGVRYSGRVPLLNK